MILIELYILEEIIMETHLLLILFLQSKADHSLNGDHLEISTKDIHIC